MLELIYQLKYFYIIETFQEDGRIIHKSLLLFVDIRRARPSNSSTSGLYLAAQFLTFYNYVLRGLSGTLTELGSLFWHV
jgi:hypothetical protein